MHTEMTFVVQDDHTDELGHLNHVAAVRMLEQARDDWYHACGLYRDDPNRYGTIIVNVNYDYHKECFIGETTAGHHHTRANGYQEHRPVAQNVKTQ